MSTVAAVRAYREAMAGFAEMRTLDVWYARRSEDELKTELDQAAKRHNGQGHQKAGAGRGGRGGEGHAEGAHPRQPPRARPSWPSTSTAAIGSSANHLLVIPAREIGDDDGRRRPTRCSRRSGTSSTPTESTLPDDRRQLLDRFEIVDVARKVVGVGSVGTRAFIVLLHGARPARTRSSSRSRRPPRSVLEDHLPASRYRQPGERVVQGQRMMQAASDIFLGWATGVRGRPVLLLAPAARHEGVSGRRVDGPAGAGPVRAGVRMDPGPRPRSVGRPDRHLVVPRQGRRLRLRRSRTSHGATPTRTSRTSRRSPTRSAPGASTPFTVCDDARCMIRETAARGE